MILKKCRVCNSEKLTKVFSLGNQPLANNLEDKVTNSKKYPLELNLCKYCSNCQLTVAINSKKLFHKYLYRSSMSKLFVNHFSKAAEKYIKIFNLNKKSFILDVGSNDGIGIIPYKNKKFFNINGIEPALNLSKITNRLGIKTYNSFLNKRLSNKLNNRYDLITASNVFAHVPKIKEFTNCIREMLKPSGVFIIEVQYLFRMLKDISFDNIYHEHVNYWSVKSLNYFFTKMNLTIFHVEEINTHGGSIRVYVKRSKNKKIKIKNSVEYFLKKEEKFKIQSPVTFKVFSKKVMNKRKKIVKKISRLYLKRKTIVGFGAPAKATTLINFYKLQKYIQYIIDDNIYKKNKFIPNTNIKITNKPKNNNIDYILVFAWNYFSEIKKRNKKIAKKFINIFSP